MSVLVWIETNAGKALPGSWEALGAAAELAQKIGCEIAALVIGDDLEAIADEAGRRGATRVLLCIDPAFAEYRLDSFAAQLSELARQRSPIAVVAVTSARARELLASSALDTGSGYISDAISLSLDEDRIVGERPVYAGKALMDMRGETATTFITLRARAFPPPSIQAESAASVERVAPLPFAETTAMEIQEVAAEIGRVSLTEAAIIVSGGRGMANNPVPAPAGLNGDAANIWKARHGYEHTLAPLADVLGAAIGASRAAVDAGYIPYEHQVGQTGKVVNPDLYIACGISGAIQHQAGMRGSNIIVAINKDAQAPIFKLARYGIVGDLYQVVPALTDALKRAMS